MANIQQYFSIKDLEKFSGIKAHTIRIWEKRYGILEPNRTETNIRVYDVEALQKILNVAFLNGCGYKISRIAKMTSTEVAKLISSTATKKNSKSKAIDRLKMAAVKFDPNLFFDTYDDLCKTHTFNEIFNFVFLPFLEQIGVLWQTDAVKPSQEHFITNLIKQKIYTNLETVQQEVTPSSEKVFVLFLPEGEVHEIGLLYLNYELLLKNYRVVFLGNSLPIGDLRYLLQIHNNVHFVSYLTIQPDDVTDYFNRFRAEVGKENTYHYWLLGRKVQQFRNAGLPKNFKIFSSIEQLISTL